jgi:hypothetical protein
MRGEAYSSPSSLDRRWSRYCDEPALCGVLGLSERLWTPPIRPVGPDGRTPRQAVLTFMQNYEIWVQLLRGEVTIARPPRRAG